MANLPAAPTAGIADLPDDLLLHCLAPLSQQDRFKSAALVSKRWAQACLSPQLLRSLKLNAKYRGIEQLSALREFLVRHGPHVRSLELQGGGYSYGVGLTHRAEATRLVAACVAACGAAGSLTRLTIDTNLPTLVLHGLAGLGRLRRLKIGCMGPITLPACMSGLTALRELELDVGEEGVECEGGQLPPGLTRLEVHNLDGYMEHLPMQFSTLTKLSTVNLCAETLADDGVEPLARLPTLRTLEWETGRLPECVAALTQLRTLLVKAVLEEEDIAGLDTVLPHLCRLGTLWLYHVNDPPWQLPASLASLPRLSRLCIDSEEEFTDEAPPALPPGPWLARLRWLGLPWPMLAASAGVLRGATQLEYLASLTVPEGEDSSDDEERVEEAGGVGQGVAAALTLLEALPALRCFAVEMYWTSDERRTVSALWQALSGLRERRPALTLRRINAAQSSFLDEMLALRDVPGSS